MLPMQQTTQLPTISERMGHPEATKQAKVLLGSYPREPHDPATFTVGVVQVLSEYPADVGRQAIDLLTRRLKHYPTRADLVEALEEIMVPRRAAHARARADAEARKKRADDMRLEEQRVESNRRFREMLGAAWDDFWAIPLMLRYNGGTPEEFAAGWKAAPDKEAFVQQWGREIQAADD